MDRGTTNRIHLVNGLSRRAVAGVLVVAAVATGCTGTTSVPSTAPTSPRTTTTTTTTTSPPSSPAATEPLSGALAAVRDGASPLTGLVAVRDGELAGEAYAPTSGPDVRQPVWSITKSVVSTLVGIAVADGDLQVDMTLSDLFGDTASRHPDVTVEHLLTMTSGLDLPDGEATFGALYRADDWVAHVLEQPATAPPGEAFAYCSACVHLLTAALDGTTDDVATWAQQRLFDPLGITDVEWERAADGSDVPIGGWGLELTARELARFGELHLDGGSVDGEQVVPADWVRVATSGGVPEVQPFEAWQRGYGYLWWLADDGAWAATGRGGQLVLVLPADRLVVAATADLSDEAAASASDFVWQEVVAPLSEG